MIVVPDAGDKKLLAMMLGSSESIDTTLSLRLFVNDYTPVAGTVTGDFTEATFTGYVRKTIIRSDWQPPTFVSPRAEMLLFTAPSEWTNGGGPVTVYGAYVVGVTTGVTLWAERFADPQLVPGGEKLRYRLKFRGRQEP